MDFTDFDRELTSIIDYLRDRLDAGDGFGTLQIYGHIGDSSTDITLITERVERELAIFSELTKEFFEKISKGEEPDSEELEEMVRNLDLLRLDMKSFVLFTRIMCDTLCRLIRLTYGKVGHQLPPSMNALLLSDRAVELDEEFFTGLREAMKWFHETRDMRVTVEHNLGSIRSTTTRNGSLGFDIIGIRDKGKSWGTNTVQSIVEYLEKTIRSLTETLRYISSKRF